MSNPTLRLQSFSGNYLVEYRHRPMDTPEVIVVSRHGSGWMAKSADMDVCEDTECPCIRHWWNWTAHALTPGDAADRLIQRYQRERA